MSRFQTNSHELRNGVLPVAQDRLLRYKKELHQQLIAGMDLSAIGTMNEERAAPGGPPRGGGVVPAQLRPAQPQRAGTAGQRGASTRRSAWVPLEPLMRDPTITDILINGPKTVYVERARPAGAGRRRLQRRTAPAPDRAADRRPGRPAGRTRPVRWSTPGLPDGSRVNAIIPPLALDGTLVSIRRFGGQPLLVSDLMAKQAITQEMVDVPRGLHEGADQHPDLRRHRQRQDDAAQRPVGLHSRTTSAW